MEIPPPFSGVDLGVVVWCYGVVACRDVGLLAEGSRDLFVPVSVQTSAIVGEEGDEVGAD